MTVPFLDLPDMNPRLKLRKSQFADLKSVAAVGKPALEEIGTLLSETKPIPLRPQQMSKVMNKVVPEPEIVECLIRQALSIQAMVESGISIADIFGGLREAIVSDSEWEAESIEAWLTAEESFRSLVANPAVRLVGRSVSLSYDYAHLLRSVRVLTDIRPLYDESAKRIDGSVISFTMRLRYDDSVGDHDVSIAMDTGDIETLIEQCTRALQKADTAQRLMADVNVPTFISGHSDDV